MAKLQSQKEKRLQKWLIPVNIFVCILCLVAIITLTFAPILKIDIGKIVRHEGFAEVVENSIDDMVGGDLEGTSQEGVNYAPVVSSIVTHVMNSVEGSVTISTLSAAKVAFAPEDDKADMVMDELFFGENALVASLIDSIIEGISNLFKTESGKQALEEAIISAIVTQLVDKVDNENLTEQKVRDMVEKFKVFEDSGNIVAAVESIFPVLATIKGEELSEEEKQALTDQVQQMYDDTKKHIEKVTFEALICVTVSKNVDLKKFDINDIFGSLTGDDENDENEEKEEGSVLSRYALTEGETGNGDGEEERVICKTYPELLNQMGFDEDNLDQLKEKLRTTLRDTVSELTEEYNEFFGYYGFLFYGMLVFIVPWAILFLFSFFHLLAKNKRFMMWYVKLYSFIPGLISLAIMLAPKIISMVAPDILEGESGPIMNAVFAGVSSFMWISGVCYILLWIVSIFWAFPIKHKIRKERKMVKKYGLTDNTAYTSAYDGGTDSYGTGYGTDSYGSDDYGSDSYGSGYGGYSGYSSYDDDDDDLY